MVFPNRTARDRGFLACPECGMEEEEGAVHAYWEGAAESGDDPDARGALARRAGQAMQRAVGSGRERVANMTPRNRILVGTALLGIAAGLLIGAYVRKR